MLQLNNLAGFTIVLKMFLIMIAQVKEILQEEEDLSEIVQLVGKVLLTPNIDTLITHSLASGFPGWSR